MTVWVEAYVPASGLNVGVASFIVYVALPTSEFVIPDFIAIAFIVFVLVTEIGELYCVELDVGVDPSVVYLIVAPLVAQLIDIVTLVVYVPVPELNVGVASLIVYVALATAEFVIPDFIAIAFIVLVLVTEIDELYCVELDVGVDPSVVYLIVAPLVVQLIDIVTLVV